jgi:cytochrome c peroxidase
MVQVRGETHLSDEAKIGKLIFFDTRLSEPNGVSCASCHSPEHGFSTPPERQQFGMSMGAVAGLFGSRNTPTNAYLATAMAREYKDLGEGELDYIGGLFLDGRVNSLAEQAKHPMLNPLEMNIADETSLVKRIQSRPYAALLSQQYGATLWNDTTNALSKITASLAAYQQSTELNRFDSKYDYYLQGKVTLSDAEQRGLQLFNDPKKGNCAACHPSTADNNRPLFTDFTYDNLGTPHNTRSPFLSLSRQFNPEGMAFKDRGLGGILNNTAHDGRFKVPTLRNIAKTAPYMYNGALPDLTTVVRFYNTACQQGNPDGWGAPSFPAGRNCKEMGDLNLSTTEINDIVSFLNTLTDGYIAK